MKVKKEAIVNFFKKTKMEGAQQLQEAIFSFEEEGLKVNANAVTKMARVMSWLKKSAFEDYEAIGKVGLNDIANVIRVLERFGEKITLKKEGNLLTLSGDGKKVDIELVSENFLETDISEPKLEFNDTFPITSVKLKEIITDVEMNKDAILTVETVDKGVKFSNTGKYKFQTTLESDTCKGGSKVSFGQPFIDSVKNLKGDLIISVSSDYPAKIIEKTDESIITLIIAPRVENE